MGARNPGVADSGVAVMSRMPAEYRPPLGLPWDWQDDETGDVPRAVWAYLGYKAAEPPKPERRQIDLLRDYLIHYIEAPCWEKPGGVTPELADLRRRAQEIRSIEDIDAFIQGCLEIGIDPL